MALAKDKPRTYLVEPSNWDSIPVAASTIIYEGAAVTIDGSGYAVNLTGTSGFAGFARRTVDNSAGGAGAKSVEVWTRGKVSINVGDTIALTDRSGPIEMSDNDTFRKGGAIAGVPVGTMQRIITPGASGANEVVLVFTADSELDR